LFDVDIFFLAKLLFIYIRLPHVLAEGIDIEEYERRTENFNIHGCWEWVEGKVVIYEFPSMPHEVCISAIVQTINVACGPVMGAPEQIYGFGSTSMY
jgi:hypothetical protein